MSRLFLQGPGLKRLKYSLFLTATGTIGTGCYYYFNGSLFPQIVHVPHTIPPPPQRSTSLYVTGNVSEEKLVSKQGTIRRAYLLLFTWYRMALLFWRAIPIAWYAVLTYGLHLCPEEVLFRDIVAFLSSMGPSYMKLGQWMATRPDWKEKKALDLLIDIDKVPINSGSIAQIHRAKLKVDLDGLPAGTSLALKVRHPGMAETMTADLEAMRILAKVVSRLVPGAYLFNLKTSLSEFEALVSSQLDLRVESDNLLQFRYNFRDFPGIIFPTPLPSLGTEELLVETFESGDPITDLECSDANSDIAEAGCHMFMKMLFEDNFVHSDLHPGNILLRTNWSPKSNKWRWPSFYLDGKLKRPRELIILDAGLVTTLSQRERNNFISLFAAVACGEGELGADLMIDRFPSIVNDNGSANSKSGINIEKFRREMKEIFDMVAPDKEGFKLSQIKIGEVLSRIMTTIRQNKAPLDGNFSSLVLTVVVGEGLGRKLTPDFNLFAEASPYLITYLEGDELFYLSKKLKDTYGGPGLLLESSHMFKFQKIFTFGKAVFLKVRNTVRELLKGKNFSSIFLSPELQRKKNGLLTLFLFSINEHTSQLFYSCLNFIPSVIILLSSADKRENKNRTYMVTSTTTKNRNN
eukprot:gene572-318_t